MKMGREANLFFELLPDRYRHTYQFKGGKKVEVVRRVAAAHFILGIMRKLKVPWERVLLRLSGWRDSL